MRVQQDEDGPTFPVIGFNLADRHGAALASVRRGRPLDLAFQVDENDWNGRTSLQLRAEDLRLPEA
jgi:single-stranded-DNA-specific exonuclease